MERGGLTGAERVDSLLDIADPGDAESEMFTDFDGDAAAYLTIADHEIEFAVHRSVELQNGPRAELHDVANRHRPFSKSNEKRDSQVEDLANTIRRA